MAEPSSMQTVATTEPEPSDIDPRTRTRIVPMRVICAGLPRTGTTSLTAALKRLGYEDTYHMRVAAYQNLRDGEMWLEAVRAKFEGIGSFEKEQWDQLLGHCQAVTDCPSIMFIPELVRAYPEAKVVLNTREFESWKKSLEDTIIQLARSDHVSRESDSEKTRYLKDIKKQLMGHVVGWLAKGDDRLKLYQEHHEMVRNLVPEENLLEYSVKEGWEPLCKFLEKPVPNEPFPRLNDTEEFWNRMRKQFDVERPKTQS